MSTPVNAIELLKPTTKQDEMFTKRVKFASVFNLSNRVGVNLQSLPPGTRSSTPHAHSHEDEFVYVVSGKGKAWLDGEVFDIGEDDCIGFRAGNGLVHNIINDGEAKEDLLLLVVGENDPEDRLYYPFGDREDPRKMSKKEVWWEPPPTRKLGTHNGWPSNPRVDVDSKYSPTLRPSPSHENPPSKDLWPKWIFHSLVAADVSTGGSGRTHEIALLSMLTALHSRVSITLHILPKSSHTLSPPRAHSKEDEVIYVLKGKAKVVTYNVEGEKEEVEVESGWAAGWPGGSSTCRSIVHNSAHEDEDLFLFVVTENFDDDKVYSPDVAEREALKAEGRLWEDYPNLS